MTELFLGGVAVVSLGFNARAGWQWWRARAVRRAERVEELAFCIEPEFLDAHAPGWREGACSVRAVKRAQRESLRPRREWVLELAC